MKNIFVILNVLFFLISLSSCHKDDISISPASKGYKIIDGITVAPEQSLFAIAEVSLLYKLNDEITIDGNTFRPILVDLALNNGTTDVGGQIVNDPSGNVIRFYPNELLAENSTFTFTAIFNWEIEKDGAWKSVNSAPEIIKKTFSTKQYSDPEKNFTPDLVIQDINQLLTTSPILVFQRIIDPELKSQLKFRPIVDLATIQLNTDSEIKCDVRWSAGRDSLFLVPNIVLPHVKKNTVRLNLHWESEVDNVWKVCLLYGRPMGDNFLTTYNLH